LPLYLYEFHTNVSYGSQCFIIGWIGHNVPAVMGVCVVLGMEAVSSNLELGWVLVHSRNEQTIVHLIPSRYKVLWAIRVSRYWFYWEQDRFAKTVTSDLPLFVRVSI